ncbi:MAG: hypothetical protein RBJ76_05145 [Stenomitos frigidus ULC029]
MQALYQLSYTPQCVPYDALRVSIRQANVQLQTIFFIVRLIALEFV